MVTKIHFISILVSTMHQCECHLQNTLKNSLHSTKEALRFITCMGDLTFDAAAHKNEQILFLHQCCAAFLAFLCRV